MGIHRTPTVTGSHIHVVAAALVLTLGVAAGCGPSEEDIRADVDKECVGLVARLSELEAEPALRQLAAAAGEAGLRFGGAAYRIEDISSEGSAVDLAAALHAASDAYDEIERQLIRREYGSLSQTAAAGKSALAQALAAAESLGATDCLGVDVRIRYFTIAADRAEAAAAKIAPTGDYLADVNAACARYADDTGIIFWKFGLRAYASELIESEPAARDYLKMVEDMVAIRTALDVTARELGLLEPPDDVRAVHAQLIEGYQGAIEGFRALESDGDESGVEVSAALVEESAAQLGVDCDLLTEPDWADEESAE